MSQFGGKSKRHFTVVMGDKEHGLYVSSSPSSAARKAITKLCASNKSKKVEFCIREITQGSKKKTYGPYLGYIEKLKQPIELKGRVIKYKPVVKLSKKKSEMKGGGFGGLGVEDFIIRDSEDDYNKFFRYSKPLFGFGKEKIFLSPDFPYYESPPKEKTRIRDLYRFCLEIDQDKAILYNILFNVTNETPVHTYSKKFYEIQQQEILESTTVLKHDVCKYIKHETLLNDKKYYVVNLIRNLNKYQEDKKVKFSTKMVQSLNIFLKIICFSIGGSQFNSETYEYDNLKIIDMN